MINKYTDPIITNYRFDKVGSRASVPITESLTVNNGFLFLKEIPDRNNVVTIGNLVEVQKPEELDSETKFYIDYNAGIVYFDSKLNGTKVNVEYSGIGIVYYPASRIYLEVDENHEIIRTLSDIEGQLSSLTNLKNQQERLKQEIEERNGTLNKAIEEAKKIDLSGSVDKANQAKTDLESTTRKANIADANLRTDIEFAKGVKIDLKKQEEQSKTEVQKSIDLANTTKTSLDGSITTANEKINKANEKVSEISSKISEANETQQKLTNTKNDITSSLSDYNKKSAEIKQSAGDIESKNSELKSTISRADESNTTLNSTIEKSKDSNTALSGTVKESKTKNTELSSSITTATDLKGQLEIKNKEASGNINSLNSKISEGTQLKSDLDTSTTNANQANAELKDTTNKANLSKTQLDESKASADELNKNLLNNKNELTTLDNSLKAENEKATKNISDLDSKSTSSKQVIDDLNSATSKSETAKTNLDDSNTKATQTNAELKATTQTANDTKTSLEQIKNESSTLSNELSEGNTTASSNIESLKSENQSAKTNITGLQTENQNALSKQETLSSETAKANEAIAKIAELITSSTDLKNKLEQIVASGDLDKYITDPKLREILTDYATKDDLSKIDVTSQLVDYAKKMEIPTLVSQLENDINYQNKENVDNAINNALIEPYVYIANVSVAGKTKHKLGIKIYNKLDDKIQRGLYVVFTFSLKRGRLNRYFQRALSFADYKCYKRDPVNQNNMMYDESTNTLTGEWGEWEEYTSQIATTQDLELKADKSSIPTSLSQLTDDETHRLVTDEEKNKWNNPPNPDLTDYTKKKDFDSFKSSVPNNIIQAINIDKLDRNTVKMDSKEKRVFNIGTMWIDRMKVAGEVRSIILSTHFVGDTTFVEQIAFDMKNVKFFVRVSKTVENFDKEKATIKCDWREWETFEIQNANMADLELKADKSSIPTTLSQLTNDTKFKTETEIQEMIANSSKLKKEVTTSLPSTGKDDVIYLVKDTKGKDNNNYLEYLWIDGKWELIGSTQVDLSGYATTEEFNEFNEFIRMEIKETKEELQAAIDSESSRFESFKDGLSPFTQQELEEAFK